MSRAGAAAAVGRSKRGGGGGVDRKGGKEAMIAGAAGRVRAVKVDPGSVSGDDFLNLYKEVRVCRTCYWVYSQLEHARQVRRWLYGTNILPRIRLALTATTTCKYYGCTNPTTTSPADV